jgi:hypothetical protein
MMIKHVVLAAAFFCATAAQAEIQVETECYVRTPTGKDGKLTRMIFRRYVDQDLKKEVGSFVQYNDTKETISLVFAKHVPTDTDSPDLGNYEDYRTEIVGKKVTGEYAFVQTGAGVRQGKFVRYTSAKTGKPVIFQYIGDDDGSCKVNR